MDNTREKLIDVFMHMGDHIRSLDEYGFCFDSTLAKAIEDVVAMLKNQDANGVTVTDTNVGKWIPVTERLPELHTKVLCCGIRGGRFIAELTTWGKEKHLLWDKRNGQGCPTVTHWMPLPEAPRE